MFSSFRSQMFSPRSALKQFFQDGIAQLKENKNELKEEAKKFESVLNGPESENINQIIAILAGLSENNLTSLSELVKKLEILKTTINRLDESDKDVSKLSDLFIGMVNLAKRMQEAYAPKEMYEKRRKAFEELKIDENNLAVKKMIFLHNLKFSDSPLSDYLKKLSLLPEVTNSFRRTNENIETLEILKSLQESEKPDLGELKKYQDKASKRKLEVNQLPDLRAQLSDLQDQFDQIQTEVKDSKDSLSEEDTLKLALFATRDQDDLTLMMMLLPNDSMLIADLSVANINPTEEMKAIQTGDYAERVETLDLITPHNEEQEQLCNAHFVKVYGEIKEQKPVLFNFLESRNFSPNQIIMLALTDQEFAAFANKLDSICESSAENTPSGSRSPSPHI